MKRASSQINYSEGTCFFVPLRDSGFARGIVARLSGKGKIFAFFFSPRLERSEAPFHGVRKQDSVLSGFCGDLGLLNEEWPIAVEAAVWDRVNWPLPALYREDEYEKRAWLSYYNDRNLDFIREEPSPFRGDYFEDYPYDRVMGYGAVEIRLTKLLSTKRRE